MDLVRLPHHGSVFQRDVNVLHFEKRVELVLGEGGIHQQGVAGLGRVLEHDVDHRAAVLGLVFSGPAHDDAGGVLEQVELGFLQHDLGLLVPEHGILVAVLRLPVGLEGDELSLEQILRRLQLLSLRLHAGFTLLQLHEALLELELAELLLPRQRPLFLCPCHRCQQQEAADSADNGPDAHSTYPMSWRRFPCRVM